MCDRGRFNRENEQDYEEYDDDEINSLEEDDEVNPLEEDDEVVMSHAEFLKMMEEENKFEIEEYPSDEPLYDDYELEFDADLHWSGLPYGGFDEKENVTGRYFNYNDTTLCGLTTRESNLRQIELYEKMEANVENAKIKIDLNLRKHVVDWLCLTQQSTGVPTRALFIAVEAFDLFTRFTPILEADYQMAALVCLKLALKGRLEDKQLDREKITRLLAAGYTWAQFMNMMRRAEIVLEEYLQKPFDSFSDLPPIVNYSDCDDVLPKPQLYLLCRYCLELGLSDDRLVKYRTNYRAAGAVLAMRHLVLHENKEAKAFNDVMSLIADIYPSNNLWGIAKIYIELLHEAAVNKYHIYTKYKQKSYGEVTKIANSYNSLVYSALSEMPFITSKQEDEPLAENPLKYPNDEPLFIVY